jgi:hypothetical protein
MMNRKGVTSYIPQICPFKMFPFYVFVINHQMSLTMRNFSAFPSGKKQRILATHALQFLFLGFTGFRFPCAHFPSTTASGYELYLLLWEAVNMV